MLSRKSTSISQGAYLADVESNISLGSFDLKDATNRPFPVPQYDPESSLDIPIELYTKANERREIPRENISKPKSSRDSTNWYPGNRLKVSSQLGIDGSNRRRSRLSLTPSVFQIGTEILSAEQTKELGRLKDAISGIPEPPQKDLDGYTEPPDGGAMAWAHTVAGHLIVFNAQ